MGSKSGGKLEYKVDVRRLNWKLTLFFSSTDIAFASWKKIQNDNDKRISLFILILFQLLEILLIVSKACSHKKMFAYKKIACHGNIIVP